MHHAQKVNMDFRNSDDSLCLFFTKGVSLKTWIESGTLNREKSLYEHLLKEEIFKKYIGLLMAQLIKP